MLDLMVDEQFRTSSGKYQSTRTFRFEPDATWANLWRIEKLFWSRCKEYKQERKCFLILFLLAEMKQVIVADSVEPILFTGCNALRRGQ